MGLDPDLLGQVLASLALQGLDGAGGSVSSEQNIDEESSSGAPSRGEDLCKKLEIDREGWLEALQTTGRFSLGVSFLRASERILIGKLIASLDGDAERQLALRRIHHAE